MRRSLGVARWVSARCSSPPPGVFGGGGEYSSRRRRRGRARHPPCASPLSARSLRGEGPGEGPPRRAPEPACARGLRKCCRSRSGRVRPVRVGRGGCLPSSNPIDGKLLPCSVDANFLAREHAGRKICCVPSGRFVGGAGEPFWAEWLSSAGSHALRAPGEKDLTLNATRSKFTGYDGFPGRQAAPRELRAAGLAHHRGSLLSSFYQRTS